MSLIKVSIWLRFFHTDGSKKHKMSRRRLFDINSHSLPSASERGEKT